MATRPDGGTGRPARNALMLELVDRLASEASVFTDVRVRVSLRAQQWQAGAQRSERCVRKDVRVRIPLGAPHQTQLL